MSDPQNPGPGEDPTSQPPVPPTPLPSEQASPTPPPAAPAYGQQQPATPPPGYPAAPAYAPPAPPTNPGKVLGIVAFVMSFFGGINVIALILGIVALVQSKKAGFKNGFALAAIIISAVLIVVGVIVIIAVIAISVSAFNEICSQLGPGVHTYTNGGATGTVTCPG